METQEYYIIEQARMPMFISNFLDPTDPVFAFNELMKDNYIKVKCKIMK